VIVVGSAAVDISAQAEANTNELALHSTVPGAVSLSFGGVGRNIAEACHRVLTSQSQSLASATLLLSPVGSDLFGRLLIDEIRKLGMRTDGMVQSTKTTAVCNMILDNQGSLIGGVADMGITEALDRGIVSLFHMSLHIEAQVLQVLQQATKHKPSIIVLDGNLSAKTITHVVKSCNEHNINGS
jgi:pseudouridine-5'-phosphate glycosidase/pseudouridine kinase